MDVFYYAEMSGLHLLNKNNATFGAKYLTELPEILWYPNVNTQDKHLINCNF